MVFALFLDKIFIKKKKKKIVQVVDTIWHTPHLKMLLYISPPPHCKNMKKKKPNHMSLYYLPLHNHEDISKEPLVQIANGNQCSVKPLRNDHGLDSASGLHK